MSIVECIVIIISCLSLLIAGIALGWNIFRDCIDHPKIKVFIGLADIYDKEKISKIISVTVTNIGKKPIIVKNHGFRMKNGNSMIFPEAMHLFNKKKLESYGFLDITLTHDILLSLLKKADKIKYFVLSDTSGKEWLPKKKVSKRFLKSLKDFKRL